MKATLIFSIVILLAAIAGCSDNMNVTDPLNATHNVQKQPNHTQDQGKGELVWSLRELKVWTVSGDVVENKATYIKTSPVPPMESTSGYLITFTASSNADRFENGYAPLARITKDGNDGSLATLYQESNFVSATGPEVEVKFNDVNFSQISFYIALFQVDGSNKLIPDNATYLTLSDIKIYRVR